MNPLNRIGRRVRDWWQSDLGVCVVCGDTFPIDGAHSHPGDAPAPAPELDDEILAIAEAAGVVAVPLPQRVPGWLDTSTAAKFRRVQHETVEVSWLQQDKAGMDRAVSEISGLAKITGTSVADITADVMGEEIEAFLGEVAR